MEHSIVKILTPAMKSKPKLGLTGSNLLQFDHFQQKQVFKIRDRSLSYNSHNQSQFQTKMDVQYLPPVAVSIVLTLLFIFFFNVPIFLLGTTPKNLISSFIQKCPLCNWLEKGSMKPKRCPKIKNENWNIFYQEFCLVLIEKYIYGTIHYYTTFWRRECPFFKVTFTALDKFLQIQFCLG